MNAHNQHKFLSDKYKYTDKFIKKFKSSGAMMQFGIIVAALSWQHLSLGHYNFAFPILGCMSLYLLTKDFLTLLRIDKNTVKVILDGVELEKKHKSLEKFFHGLLESFNFLNVIIQRTLNKVLILCILGYLTFQFIKTEMPDFKVSLWILSVAFWIPGIIACRLYYNSMKVLDEAQEKLFPKTT